MGKDMITGNLTETVGLCEIRKKLLVVPETEKSEGSRLV
jgi:hypothetical protein